MDPPNSDESQPPSAQDQTIMRMIQRGIPGETICAFTGASKLKVSAMISQTMAKLINPNMSDFGMELSTKTAMYDSSRTYENPVLSPSQQQASPPGYIYTSSDLSCRLYATKLSTKQITKITLPSILFDKVNYLVMLPTGKIFFPFINVSNHFFYNDSDNSIDCYDSFKTALVIDPFKEIAVLKMPQLPRERNNFVAIYHSSYVYVIGGTTFKRLFKASNKCDRFDCRTNLWETIAPLPQKCYQANAVGVNNCLFVLGGICTTQDYALNIIQRLNLYSMEWDILPINLPYAKTSMAIFSRNSQVYFVANKRLYTFTPDSINFIQKVRSSPYAEGGPSYLYKTTLFCTTTSSPANIFELGEIEAFGS